MKRHLLVLAASTLIASSALAADIKFNGDFRFRHELVTDESPGANDTVFNRERIALRFGSLVSINNVTNFEFRLATGNGVDSSFWTLGNDNLSTLGNYLIAIDRAFFSYTGLPNFTLVGGRVKNVFYTAGGSDMIASADLNFDALGGAYVLPLGDFKVFVNAAQVWLNQNEAANDPATATTFDSMLSALQVGARHKIGDIDYGFAGALYSVNNNRLLGKEYKLINAGVDVAMKAGELPVAVFFDFVTNGSAATLADGKEHGTGFLVGAKVGSTKKAGDWMVAYDYRSVKADAVIDSIDSSDNVNATNVDGQVHRAKAFYVLADGFTASLAGILGKEKTVAVTPVDTNKNKVQIDLAFAF